MRHTPIFNLINAALYARYPRIVKRYKDTVGAFPNIALPRDYTERMIWRRLIDHNPQFVTFCDKLATKDYMRARCPDLPVAEVLWQGTRPEDIPDDVLAGDVFVKCNHGCAYNMRVTGGIKDRRAFNRQFTKWVNRPFGRHTSQWGYRNVERTIFVERALGDGGQLLDIAVRASNGRAVLGSITEFNKTARERTGYLDLDGTPREKATKLSSIVDDLDNQFFDVDSYRQAVACAAELSRGVDYARFDFLSVGGKLYGGEITIYPAAGGSPIADPVIHHVIMTGWDLRKSGFLQNQQQGLWRHYAEALRERVENGELDGSYLTPQAA